MQRKNFHFSWMKEILAFLFFFVATTYITIPLIFHLHEYSTGLIDELYIGWILNWSIHALSTNPLTLFNGNIYFPYSLTLSFSDLYLISSLISFLPVKLFGEPLLAYNINFFLSFIFLGFFTYLLVLYLSSDRLAGITSGTILAFSTYTLTKLGHLQVLTIYWIPLCILFYVIFLQSNRFRFFLLTLIIFYFQFLNSFMPAYFLLFFLIGLTCYEIFVHKKNYKKFINRRTTAAVLFFLLLSIPIILPYYQTSQTFNYVRDIRDTIHSANRPEFFLFSFGASRIAPVIRDLLYPPSMPVYYDGYRGLASIILTLLALGYVIFSKKRPQYFTFFMASGIFAYILSLGPTLQWAGHVIKHPFIIPLPYAFLYYLAPGFKGFRNSGRIEAYEIVVFSIAIGLMLAFMLRKSKFRLPIHMILIAIVLFEFAHPIKYIQLPNKNTLPPVYKYLQTIPRDAAIIEMPIYNWDMFPYSLVENKRLYYSSFHLRKTVNGGGGFSPLPWQDFVRSIAKNFPNKKAIDSLKKIGVQYIIVHLDEYDKLFEDNYNFDNTSTKQSQDIFEILNANKNIIFINKFGRDVVFKMNN